MASCCGVTGSGNVVVAIEDGPSTGELLVSGSSASLNGCTASFLISTVNSSMPLKPINVVN